MNQESGNSNNQILTPAAFEDIFKKWYRPLCKTAFRYIYNEQAVEDIVQDVFVKLWQRRNNIIFEHSVKAYLYRSVINGCINYSQKNNRNIHWTEKEWVTLVPGETTTEEKINYNEAQEQITLSLNSLPPECKNIFMLSRFENMSNKEIAEVLGISIKTVENQMTKALKILRQKLNPLLKNLDSFY